MPRKIRQLIADLEAAGFAEVPGGKGSHRDSRGESMKTEDRYLKFVRWSDEDALYVGYCPDLFPWGGVCHDTTEAEAYRQLSEIVREEGADLSRQGRSLPEPATRPMRDAVPA